MAGGDASQMPAALDPNWINRKFEAIEQWQREMMPSVAQSVTGIVNEITARFPIASVIANAANAVPTGWILADGAAISRTTYADLFVAIGTTYGVGDGSTTFNVPDVKGRIPVGYDASIGGFNNYGQTGGEITHTLTAAEMPSHTHSQASHSHTIGTRLTGITGSNLVAPGSSTPTIAGTTQTNADSGSANPAIGSAGSDGAHNNLQPYIVLPYIIKHYKF